ncbi:hypothetical protein [Pseudomonas amygdali]|uniref:hypothetical protein n=1 Tax=Pseudomonas amygdali TaxID=47877 RepID=UPI0006B88E58|nr:hypothetical protein [Pseudomonas amygdali]
MSQVKERPILFSAPMVRAILSGQKTVTRRVMKVQPVLNGGFWEVYGAGWGKGITSVPVMPGHSLSSNCPYGRIGERLWVREAWQADAQVNAIAPRELSHGEPIQYPADGSSRQTGCSMITPGKTRPSIHMPRWVSRILLEITDVRVERLQDISEEQATAEGVGADETSSYRSACVDRPAGFAFRDLWTGINGSDSWDENPWVWVVEFKRVAP